MPKKLLLLLIVLLIGGYFFFARGGSPTEEKLPSLTLKAVVNEGENGYIVGAEGTLTLPMEKEYNVQGEVYLSVNGTKVKSSQISSTVKGPSTLPLSLAGSEISSENVSVGADLTVRIDNKEMPFKIEVPVTFPPKSASLQLPAVGISVASFDIIEGGYDTTLEISFYNPNSFDVDVTNVTLKVADSTYPVSVGTVPSKERVFVEVPLTVEGNVIDGEISGKVKWDDLSKGFTYKFKVGFPSITPPEPIYSLKVDIKGISSSGITLDTNVMVKNPSTIPITLSSLTLKIEKGEFSQTKDLASSVSLGPLEEKYFATEITSVPFLTGGNIILEADGNKVISMPLEVVPSNLVKPPELNLWVEEFNGGGGVVHVLLKNPNDYNLDVENLDVEVLVSGSDVANFTPISLTLQDSKEINVGSADSPLAIVPDQTWIVVTYRYGVKDLDLMFNQKYSTLYTG